MDDFQQITDEALWMLCLKGDEKAFECLYRRYYQMLLCYGLNINPDQDVVKDAIQDLFVRLMSGRRRLSETTSVKGYLLRALKNSLIDIFDRKQRELEFLYSLNQLEMRGGDEMKDAGERGGDAWRAKDKICGDDVDRAVKRVGEEVCAEVRGEVRGGEREGERGEAGEEVRGEKEYDEGRLEWALKKLLPRHREILYLYYVRNLNHTDIAQAMNLSYQSSKNLLHRALVNLRKIYFSEGGYE